MTACSTQPPVLARQQPRRAEKAAYRSTSRPSAMAPTMSRTSCRVCGDLGLDRRRVLVDLVGADDHAAVGARGSAGRSTGTRSARPRSKTFSVVAAVRELGRRRSPAKTSEQVVLDRELPAPQRRQVGEDDRAVLAPRP